MARPLALLCFFLLVWSELEQPVPPLLPQHLAGILGSQQNPSVRHRKLSSISWNEKLCGFADDLLSGGIQDISSSQTLLPATVEIQYVRVMKPCSVRSLPELHSRVLNQRDAAAPEHSHTPHCLVYTYNLEQRSGHISHPGGQTLDSSNKNENKDHQSHGRNLASSQHTSRSHVDI